MFVLSNTWSIKHMPRLRPRTELATLNGRWNFTPHARNGNARSLTSEFLADFEEDWRAHGKAIFPLMREKAPELYFGALVTLAKTVTVKQIEVGAPGSFDQAKSKQEVLAKFEERAGLKARLLFEAFLKRIEKLEAEEEDGQVVDNSEGH